MNYKNLQGLQLLVCIAVGTIALLVGATYAAAFALGYGLVNLTIYTALTFGWMRPRY